MSTIDCSAGCKRSFAPDDKGAAPPGWESLPLTGRWRCMACSRELAAANHLPGTPARFEPDPLPPDSIGALKQMPKRVPLRESAKP